MPKTLVDWLHYQALKWQLTGTAHRHLSGVWHRMDDDIPGWSNCGKAWLAKPHLKGSAGRGYRRQSPWHDRRTVMVASLCRACFADEIPVLETIRRHDDG